MKKLLSILLILALLSLGGGSALAQEPTAEPTQEATAEPVAEPTQEATAEPVAEPTQEATVEPTVEPTQEATVEPTIEPTATITPTVTPTATIETPGRIEAQAFSGSFASTVVVQNMGSGDATVSISWYTDGAASPCETTSDSSALSAGASRVYSPPAGNCGTAWSGSAVVSSSQPLAAVVETIGTPGNVLSEYSGSSSPSTEAWIFPGPIFSGNNSGWDPLTLGISNAGSQDTVVRVTLVNKDGSTHATKDVNIPDQSAVQLDLQDEIKASPGDFTGSIQVENAPSGSNQPLYAVLKGERVFNTDGKTPVSNTFEGFRETSDAATEWFVTLANRSVKQNTSSASGLNTQIGITNVSGGSVDIQIQWFNRNGTLETTTSFDDVANGEAVNPFAAQINLNDKVQSGKTTWGGSAVINATGNVIAIVQPTYKNTSFFNAWGSFKPVIKAQAEDKVYVPNVRRAFNNGARTGTGWCTIINVGNLDLSNSVTFNLQIVNQSGTAVYNTASSGGDITLSANGSRNFDTCGITQLAGNGGVFDGSAIITVTGGTGPIAALTQHTIKGWPSGADPFAYYNPPSTN